MLADAEMKVPSCRTGVLEISRTLEFQRRLVRSRQIGRASNHPGNVLGDHVENLARTLASRDALGVRRERWQILVPSCRQFAVLHAAQTLRQLWIFRRIFCED